MPSVLMNGMTPSIRSISRPTVRPKASLESCGAIFMVSSSSVLFVKFHRKLYVYLGDSKRFRQFDRGLENGELPCGSHPDGLTHGLYDGQIGDLNVGLYLRDLIAAGAVRIFHMRGNKTLTSSTIRVRMEFSATLSLNRGASLECLRIMTCGSFTMNDSKLRVFLNK